MTFRFRSIHFARYCTEKNWFMWSDLSLQLYTNFSAQVYSILSLHVYSKFDLSYIYLQKKTTIVSSQKSLAV